MRKKSRKLWWILGALVIVTGLGVTGFVVMSRPANEIDSSRLATVERGDITRSVVATGRIEPGAKVEIKSKANGIISPVSSILNMGAAATLVMILGDINQVYVRGKVDEADIGVVKLGQPSRIKVETFKDKTFDGKVTQISPLGVDKDNVVTFEVKVSINNPGNLLRAKMTANAEIVLEEHKGALLVPESAVIYDNQHNASVEIPAPGQPKGRERKSIKVGISNGTRTEALEGLSEKQQIILQ